MSRRTIRLLLAGALLLSSCSILGTDDSSESGIFSDGPGPDAGETTETDPATSIETDGGQPIIEAQFVEGVCEFEAPADTDPRCGTVSVPMEWETGQGRIELAVAVFPTTSDDPAPDPVVYLEGGPGGHALETVRFLTEDLLAPLQTRGEVIFFDQRGAGLSRPSLACEELDALDREIEDNPGQDQVELDARFHEQLGACRDRLTAEGVDLAAFTTINNAHDVEAVRVALGYDQWNLYGISYGTKLGLEVMRQHPDGVRSVIIDSVFPPQVDSALENPSSFLASLNAVVEACDQEPACSSGGDLGERLATVAQSYDQSPVQVEVTDFLTNETDEIYVEGETIVGIVSQALYSPSWFTDLPELVAELEVGETGAVEQFLSQQRTTESFFTSGMFFAIECNEEVPFADPAEVSAALPADPFGLRDRFNYASNNGTNAFGTCEAFGATPADPVSNEPVVSDIPTLVMAGRFDPVTPVSWAEAAAATLANSFLVVAPSDSHGVSTGRCGSGIVLGFLDDPTAAPDSSCLDEASLAFLGPADLDVELEVHQVARDGGTAVTTVRPRDWTHGNLPGDSYRQASFLDPTQLIQVVDQPNITGVLESYVANQFEIRLGPAVDRDDVGGRSWRYRSGRSDTLAAEWYETEIDGAPAVVLLVVADEELETTIDRVLMPALAGIEATS